MREIPNNDDTPNYFRTGWMLAVGGTALFALKSIFIKLAYLERLTLYTYPIMTTVLGWLWLREVITLRVLLATAGDGGCGVVGKEIRCDGDVFGYEFTINTTTTISLSASARKYSAWRL
ncbi:hypothetical protein [Candidatus Thiothrix anitrata]|uniref:EamA domain-containing protein n=1 Tax=Candidatus Thiothrix anitrata TaxID=2823902 RepID=A0ABX7X5V6_9GAMM|nr:hypothetical protein [Candidatus Thiothrix anitrata]QTR51260.1 hypothetical protein J8380_06840 [Candidatus Thiothrix anitrata]